MFFNTGDTISRIGTELFDEIRKRLGTLGVTEDDLALTLLVHPEPLMVGVDNARPLGFSYNGRKPFYPASVVKSFYLAAVEAAIDEGRIQLHDELERAMRDMILWSSNTATNYIIDLISETTGDTLLEGDALIDWQQRRQTTNRYFQNLDWAELDGINVCQKLMDDERYGREKMFATLGGNNHNRLNSEGTARLFFETFSGTLGNPQRCARMRKRFHRSLAPAFTELDASQIAGYFGAGLPTDATLYSKAGWNGWTGDPLSSYNRHDSAYVELPANSSSVYRAFTLVLFSHGKGISMDEACFPAIARRTYELVERMQPD